MFGSDRGIGVRLDRLHADLTKFRDDTERRMLGLELRDDRRGTQLTGLEAAVAKVDTTASETNGRVTELERGRIHDEAVNEERERQSVRRSHDRDKAESRRRWEVDVKMTVLGIVALLASGGIGAFIGVLVH